MKINVTLELTEAEVSVATELLAVLKSITDQIQAAPPVLSIVDAGAKLPVAPAPAPAVTPQGHGNGIAAAPQAQPEAIAAQPAQDNIQKMRALVASVSASDPTSADMVVAQLLALLGTYPDQPTGMADLIEAFSSVVFDPALLVGPVQAPIAHYFALLNRRFPAAMDPDLRKRMVQRVLNHMTKKRPVTVDRKELILQAEAFAILVKLECIKLDGALQTLEKLVVKPDNRAAAITMLGKTLDINKDILHNAPHALYARLWSTIQQHVTDAAFQYDLEYISGVMSGLTVQQQPAAAAAAPPPPAVEAPAALSSNRQLVSTRLLEGHSDMVFCVAWDPATATITTVSKDKTLCGWNGSQGTCLARVNLVPGCYCVGLDVQSQTGIVAVANVPEGSGHPRQSSISMHSIASGWQELGRIERTAANDASALHFMPPELPHMLAEAEQDAQGNFVVNLFDISRAGLGTIRDLQPLTTYQSNEFDMWTCLATTSAHPQLIISGSRDSSILVWDTRIANRASGLLFNHQEPSTGAYRAHSKGVTTLDAQGHYVVSAGLDGIVSVWDLRRMASPGQDMAQVVTPLASFLVAGPDTPIFKVAFALSPSQSMTAYASMQGVFTLDWGGSLETPILRPASYPDIPALKAAANTLYHDVKWAPGQGGNMQLLAAASEGNVVNVFSF
ncbi:WD40-repeat-containing domain protein [Haematococcus lacustris]